MQISAAQVKTLRERTGAGMMECKKALVEAGGDIEVAVEVMRKSGAAKADKKAGRVAADGMVGMAVAGDGLRAAMVEVNSETDFVAKEENFQGFVQALADIVLREQPADVEALSALTPEEFGGDTVEDTRRELVAKVGENIAIRRLEVMAAAGDRIGKYQHGARIAVLVDMTGGSDELARDVAMHVAASRPVCLNEDSIPAGMLDKEREIFAAQAAESGKPPEIVEKMVAGRIKKFVKEVTLLGQPFIKDPDTTVGKLLTDQGARVNAYVRMEVGEGIEKKAENFAEEVAAQARG